MTLEYLRKNGWFDDKREEVGLPELTIEQIQELKAGENIFSFNGKETFLIFLRKNVDIVNLTEDDIVIRRISLGFKGEKEMKAPNASEAKETANAILKLKEPDYFTVVENVLQSMYEKILVSASKGQMQTIVSLQQLNDLESLNPELYKKARMMVVDKLNSLGYTFINFDHRDSMLTLHWD